MRSKLFIGLICTMLIVPFVNAQPKVKLGGLFYVYSFMWKNADFNGDTDDGDQHFYLHGDLHGTADFGKGISAKVKIGDWGTFGRHSIFGTGPDGLAVPSWYYGWDEVGVHIMEAYLMASNLWDSPFGLQVGKQHVLYGDGMVAFDGGEDGFMGGKLFYNHEMFDMDLFWYRLIEGGGTSYIGSGMTNIPDDLDLFGAYGTLKLMEGGIHLSPYWFWRTESWKFAPEAKDTVYSDNPMWLGGRVEGTPMAGLHFKGEVAMMMGKYEDMMDTLDYKGMAFMGEANYSLDEMGVPVSFGGAYVSFSGDDDDTDDEWKVYESATNGPYTFGFYKGWPGFGPAHTLLTGYGFACCAYWESMMANLNVINGHLQYATGPVALRVDFFNYARNAVPEGVESAMGNEIGVHMTYNYMDALTFGFAGGYFMPGEYFGEDLDAMLGGYIYMAKGF